MLNTHNNLKSKAFFHHLLFCRYVLITIAILLYSVVYDACYPINAFSATQIDVTSGQVEPLPVAIANFQGIKTHAEYDLGKKITEIIINDLGNSGVFKIISDIAFLEMPLLQKKPEFHNWRKINATILLVGNVHINNRDRTVTAQFKIWDPYNETQLDEFQFTINQKSWRRIAHRIADRVYYRLIGDDGYFDTKIAFISKSISNKKSIKRLAIMDQDGANFEFLTSGRDLVLTPRFDPSNHRLVYMRYVGKKSANVFVLDLNTRVSRLLWKFDGISFAPRFAPDGRTVAMSIAKDGTTGIYELNLINGNVKKLISDMGAISTSPSYSPDGSQIAFNSDRAGTRQIYIMNRNGANINKISNGEGAYATPVWSPRGDFIAFTKIYKGQFYIGVMRPDGTGERLLTTGWLEEGPTWSTNGRVIIFCRHYPNGTSNLHLIDLTGYYEREIALKFSASEPDWSSSLD